MANMTPLADFPATVCRVKTLVDNGIRLELDLNETEGQILTIMHNLKLENRILRIVVYDNDEFADALRINGG